MSSSKLSPQQEKDLLQKYEPILSFSEGEYFFPMNVDTFLDNSHVIQAKVVNSLGRFILGGVCDEDKANSQNSRIDTYDKDHYLSFAVNGRRNWRRGARIFLIIFAVSIIWIPSLLSVWHIPIYPWIQVYRAWLYWGLRTILLSLPLCISWSLTLASRKIHAAMAILAVLCFWIPLGSPLSPLFAFVGVVALLFVYVNWLGNENENRKWARCILISVIFSSVAFVFNYLPLYIGSILALLCGIYSIKAKTTKAKTGFVYIAIVMSLLVFCTLFPVTLALNSVTITGGVYPIAEDSIYVRLEYVSDGLVRLSVVRIIESNNDRSGFNRRTAHFTLAEFPWGPVRVSPSLLDGIKALPAQVATIIQGVYSYQSLPIVGFVIAVIWIYLIALTPKWLIDVSESERLSDLRKRILSWILPPECSDYEIEETSAKELVHPIIVVVLAGILQIIVFTCFMFAYYSEAGRDGSRSIPIVIRSIAGIVTWLTLLYLLLYPLQFDDNRQKMCPGQGWKDSQEEEPLRSKSIGIRISRLAILILLLILSHYLGRLIITPLNTWALLVSILIPIGILIFFLPFMLRFIGANAIQSALNYLSRQPDVWTNVAKGKYEAKSQEYHYYGRVINDEEKLILQYHYFYAFNDWRSSKAKGMNQHEGDWEIIAIVLTTRDHLAPLGVTLSRHESSELVLWPDMDVYDDHPHIFVALGSHANYAKAGVFSSVEMESGLLKGFIDSLDKFFKSGDTNLPVDIACGDGITIGNQCTQRRFNGLQGPWKFNHISDETAYPWLNYRGRWGYYCGAPGEDGPTGPKWGAYDRKKNTQEERPRWNGKERGQFTLK